MSKSILRMQNPDTLERNIVLARLKPSELLIGDNPRLIDEWQTAPQLWDSIRLSADIIDTEVINVDGKSRDPNHEKRIEISFTQYLVSNI